MPARHPATRRSRRHADRRRGGPFVSITLSQPTACCACAIAWRNIRPHARVVSTFQKFIGGSTMRIAALSGWTSEQKHVVAASFLGWALDAFDFFLLVFVLRDIAKEFTTDITAVTLAITLTLAMRPIGAYIFGRAADRWGRRPVLMVDVLLYSVLEFATGFSPNLTTLLVLRALFGIAMGGEWGVGASLTMESIPPHARGFVSGLLQSGYPAGYFLASIVYGLLFQYIGWRGMFMVGAIPALLVFYIRRSVPESPTWRPTDARSRTLTIVQKHWRLGIYAVLLMTAFNFFSHGTQDL